MSGPYYIQGFEEIKESGIGGFRNNVDSEYGIKPSGDGIIDVLNDFSWSASPRGNAGKVLPVYLQERKLKLNSLVASALYFLNAGVRGATPEQFKKFIAGVADTTISDSDIALINSSKSLQSYLGIYQTSLDNCYKYSLPYFGDNLLRAKNMFQDNPQITGAVSQIYDDVTNFATGILNTINLTTPGTYIEKPKHFHYPTDGESVTIEFPLLNTIRHGDKIPYQQNYELLWILTYQNKPYRTSFSRILPPRVYTLQIPGQKFFPYCYISEMNVSFEGQRRKLQVNLPLPFDTQSFETIIPEAYKVSITFQSLLADVGNMMISPYFGSNITVQDPPPVKEDGASSIEAQQRITPPASTVPKPIFVDEIGYVRREDIDTRTSQLNDDRSFQNSLDSKTPELPKVGPGLRSLNQLRTAAADPNTLASVSNFIASGSLDSPTNTTPPVTRQGALGLNAPLPPNTSL